MFSILSETEIKILATCNLSSANALNSVKSKKLLFSKESFLMYVKSVIDYKISTTAAKIKRRQCKNTFECKPSLLTLYKTNY